MLLAILYVPVFFSLSLATGAQVKHADALCDSPFPPSVVPTPTQRVQRKPVTLNVSFSITVALTR